MENYQEYKERLVGAIQEGNMKPSAATSQKSRNKQIKTIYKFHDRAADNNKYPQSSVHKSYQDHLKSQNKAEKDWHEAGTNKDSSKQIELNHKASESERRSDEKYRQYWQKYRQNKRADKERDEKTRQEVKNLPKNEEVEYEEIEVEPVFLISEEEELTEENTAIIIEDEELSEELLNELKGNQKYANFNGHRVLVDKNSGVIQSGEFKGKRVNLVKDRQRTIKKTYKEVDKELDSQRRNPEDVRNLNRRALRADKNRDDKLKKWKGAINDYKKHNDSIENEKNPIKRVINKVSPSVKNKTKELRDKKEKASFEYRVADGAAEGAHEDRYEYVRDSDNKRLAGLSKKRTLYRLSNSKK